jgi:hypothetical protein
MGVAANTVQTYSNKLLFQDLADTYALLTPTETPFQQAVPKGTADSTNPNWPLVKLNNIDPQNRVIEGEDDPATDTATLGVQLSNYTQISDKKILVSHSSEKAKAAAGNIQRLAKQMVLKLKEMKRDKEVMFLQNVPAIPGASGTARQMAGVTAFLTTNTEFAAGGADPTLSGSTEGYPNAAAVSGTTPRALTEELFNLVLQSAWENGGDPTLVLCNGTNKRIISETFTGNATRYKDTMDKKTMNAIDFYEGDFGTVTIVPHRTMLKHDAAANGTGGTRFQILFLDPNYAEICYFDPIQEKPLAATGHNEKRLLWCEYTLKIENEAAHGIIRDLNGVMP